MFILLSVTVRSEPRADNTADYLNPLVKVALERTTLLGISITTARTALFLCTLSSGCCVECCLCFPFVRVCVCVCVCVYAIGSASEVVAALLPLSVKHTTTACHASGIQCCYVTVLPYTCNDALY